METLADIARFLAFLTDTVEIRRRELWCRPAFDKPFVVVARLNLSNAVVLAPVYREADMVLPARNVGKNDAAESVAAEIVHRLMGLPLAA